MKVSPAILVSFPITPSRGTPTLKVSNKPDINCALLLGNAKPEDQDDNKFLFYSKNRNSGAQISSLEGETF